jgi:hypothetical protein
MRDLEVIGCGLCLDKFLAFFEGKKNSSWSRSELGIFLYEAKVINSRLQYPHFKVINMAQTLWEPHFHNGHALLQQNQNKYEIKRSLRRVKPDSKPVRPLEAN